MTQFEVGVVEAVGLFATILVNWGMYKANLTNQDTATKHLQTEVELAKKEIAITREQFATKIYELNEIYVNFTHFNETMNYIREAQKEIKSDMQIIIELLSKR